MLPIIVTVESVVNLQVQGQMKCESVDRDRPARTDAFNVCPLHGPPPTTPPWRGDGTIFTSRSLFERQPSIKSIPRCQ